jgi:hypothetical protein
MELAEGQKNLQIHVHLEQGDNEWQMPISPPIRTRRDARKDLLSLNTTFSIFANSSFDVVPSDLSFSESTLRMIQLVYVSNGENASKMGKSFSMQSARISGAIMSAVTC